MDDKVEKSDAEMHSSEDEAVDEFDDKMDEEEEEEVVPPIDDSIGQLVGHSKDVFCLAVSSSTQWLASGSEDDSACVWNLDETENAEPYFRIADHADTVNSLSFNASSSLLATADMSGCIICTELSTRNRRCKIDNCSDVEWISWHNVADILFAGTSDGMIWMWLIGKKGVQQSKVYAGVSGAACTKGQLLPDSKRLLSVYADGAVRLWDLKSGDAAFTAQLSAACFSIAVHPVRPLAAIGCADGTTSLFNTESNKLVNKFGVPAEADPTEPNSSTPNDDSNSVEVVSFAPAPFPWLLTATSAGHLVVYDVESGMPRHECEHDGHAVVNAVFHAVADGALRLLSICMDGGVRVWDAKSGDPIKAYSCGGCGIYDFCIAQRNESTRILVACNGGAIRVFDF